MIEKWYCLRCDSCGEVINYWQTSSIKKAIALERKEPTKITKRVSGIYRLICQDCQCKLIGFKRCKCGGRTYEEFEKPHGGPYYRCKRCKREYTAMEVEKYAS